MRDKRAHSVSRRVYKTEAKKNKQKNPNPNQLVPNIYVYIWNFRTLRLEGKS